MADSDLSLELDNGFVERLELDYHLVMEEVPYLYLPGPSKEEIKNLVQTSLWASLTKEEGRFHSFYLAFMPSDEDGDDRFFVFRNPSPFDPKNLAKIAPALQPSVYIGVWREKHGNELCIWGFASATRGCPLYIEAWAAGEIVVSLPSGRTAVVTPAMGTRFIDFKKASLIHTRSRGLTSEGNCEAPKRVYPKDSDLKEIARTMRRHGHGGTLLVIPNNVEDVELDGLIHTDRFPYRCHIYEKVKADVESRERALRKREREVSQAEEEDADLIFFDEPEEESKARESLRFIGELTAVDGATLITYDFVLLGFGAKIKEKSDEENKKLEKVFVSEPFEDSKEEEWEVSRLGGTRHQSAAQFVYNQKDSIAIVASQDGAVSFFAWDNEKNAVTVIRHAEFVL